MNKRHSHRTRLLRRGITFTLTLFVLFTATTSSTAAQQSSARFSLDEGQQFSNTGRQVLSISPDGTQFVYVANNSLYVKPIVDPKARKIEGTPAQGAVTNPVFSPDGKFIAFWAGQDQTIKRISVSGGTAQTVCQAQNPFGLSWASDNTILFGQGANGIRRVPAAGGTPETIVTVKTGELAHGPQLLPGGDFVLFTLAANSSAQGGIPPALATILSDPRAAQLTAQEVASLIASANSVPNWDGARIVVQSLKTRESKTLIEGGSDARYAPTGHLVYATGGKLMSVRFDARELVVSGAPAKLLEGIRTAGNSTGTTQFSFSNTGSLVYLTVAGTQQSSQRQMAFVDFNGKVTPLRHVPGTIFGPRISPDGKQVAYRDGNAIWIADLNSEAPPRQLTTEPGEGPIWSPDGKRIAYISILNGMEALYWRLSDGTGTAELLAERARAPESWAADNQSFTYITLIGPSGDAGDYDIWSYSIRDKKAAPLITIPMSAQSGSRLSPDGKWIAYESNESGRAEIFVEPLPRNGQRFQVSKSGGARPLWATDMSKLYFDNNAGRILSVGVQMQPAFTWTEPEMLPMKDFVQPSGTIRRQYDLTPDGKQFMMMFQGPSVPPYIEITTSWFDQLKSL